VPIVPLAVATVHPVQPLRRFRPGDASGMGAQRADSGRCRARLAEDASQNAATYDCGAGTRRRPVNPRLAMNRRRLLLAAAAMMPAALLGAETGRPRTYRDQGFVIELPSGYLGPVEHASGTSVSRGFRKPLPQSVLNTVIMITVQDNGPSFARRLVKERGVMTRETLEPIIENIGRNRANFHRGEPRPVMLSGIPGLKAAWSGVAQGAAFDGIVYCVLVGARAYAIQIQDPAGLGNARLAEAVRAVERMRFDAS
jgi:hypothetical protein